MTRACLRFSATSGTRKTEKLTTGKARKLERKRGRAPSTLRDGDHPFDHPSLSISSCRFTSNKSHARVMFEGPITMQRISRMGSFHPVPPAFLPPAVGRTIFEKKDDSDQARFGCDFSDRGRDGRDDDVGVGRHRVSDPSPTPRVATHLDAREVGKLNVRANLHASRESYDAHRPRAGLEGVSRARDRFRHFGGTNQRTCRKRTISSRDRRSARDRVKNRCG